MEDVKFNLQDHLRDMEDRITGHVGDVHTDVKDVGMRLRTVEQDQAALKTKVKWLWTTVTGAVVASAQALFGP